MGSNTRRKARRWLGGVISHAVLVKDGVGSGRTICTLDVKTIDTSQATTQRCHGCQQSINHNVLVQWVKP